MKNLHLLKTDKSSRLYTNMQGVLSKDELKMRLKNQNIYITNSEEIKEGDWCLLDHNVGQSIGHSILKCLEADVENGEYLFQDKDGDKFTTGRCEKIILTTDTKLIQDGVQAIDDDFLEWFVKNPSCEEVEVKPLLSNNGRVLFSYKIIIPKEEAKQETQGYICPHTKKQCDDECCVSVKDCHLEASMGVLSEPKQETLEEAIGNWIDANCDRQDGLETLSDAIKFGAKWQQERMYIEEEVKSMLQKRLQSVGIFSSEKATEVWFKQYKKQ